MNKIIKYKIPDEYFFRLHHVRPRFKNDVEEVLLYVANSISEMDVLPISEFNENLNKTFYEFKKNSSSTKKTIDNWRTEISSLFAFIQSDGKNLKPSLSAIRLSNNQYLDEFFNYFLFSFQYPGGHIKSQNIIPQIEAGIKFNPCKFILDLLIEGEKITGKPFSVISKELTQCAYFDLRVTRDHKKPKDVASMIINHRKNKIEYDHLYEQLKTKDGEYISSGDVYRYAGDILDYMVLANLLTDKGTGYYYYLNAENKEAINYHINNSTWFSEYDKYYKQNKIINSDIASIEEIWFSYVNNFDNIEAFTPKLNSLESKNISNLIQEYYSRLTGDKKAPTKIIGDYGESLVLAHEYLRTKNKSNRQHLINKIPTPLAVGFDIQSIEIDKRKRYIEVKTTKSKKALKNNRFKVTPNEWDTAETLGENYFIYYLVVNETEKNIFIIQNPVKQYNSGNLKIDQNLLVEFKEASGKWEKLQEIIN